MKLYYTTCSRNTDAKIVRVTEAFQNESRMLLGDIFIFLSPSCSLMLAYAKPLHNMCTFYRVFHIPHRPPPLYPGHPVSRHRNVWQSGTAV